MRDWVEGLLFASAAAGLLMLWVRTGSSPLVWTAWVCLHAEATRIQVWESVQAFFHHFRLCYPHTSRAVTSKIALHMLAAQNEERGDEVGIEVES